MLDNNMPEKFYIYGTGQYARIFMSWLWAKKCKDRVSGFIVSSRGVGQDEFCGVSVFGFNEIESKLNDTTLYIAISKENAVGIADRLKDVGANSIQITYAMLEEMEGDLFDMFSADGKAVDQVVVWSYWGMGYYDQCKYIVNELHKRDKGLKIYWVIKDIVNTPLPDWITAIAIGSYDYYEVMSRSRFLITNVDSPSSCIYKRDYQYFIYTWHGIGPSKRLEWESPLHRKRITDDKRIVKNRWNGADIMVAGSNFCHEVYRKSFLYEGVIEDWGYPRNDIFFKDGDFKKKLYETFGIEGDKKIILYAPTFRNELMESRNTERLKQIYDIDLIKIREAAERKFGGEFVVMYRFHNYVYRYVDISSYKQNAIDATYYPDMQELLKTVDILITDYSSSMWDFSLTRKPVFLYFHDAEEYEEKYQGFYVFPDNYPYPKGHTNEELCEAIASFSDEKYQGDLDKWFEKYGTYDDGHASERIAYRIFDVMKNPSKYGK